MNVEGASESSLSTWSNKEIKNSTQFHAISSFDGKEVHSDSEIFIHNDKINLHPAKKKSRATTNSGYFCNIHIRKRLFDFIYNVIVKKSRQTTLSFILGVIVGVTLTAMLFQYNFLIKSHSSRRSNELEGGFFIPTLPPLAEPNLDFDANTKEKNDVKSQFDSDDAMQTLYDTSKQIGDDIKTGARVFVGVITAEKFLSTRAQAVNSTWGSQVDKVSFFTEKGTSEEYGISVVNLDGVSDKEYPPQKKAFKMLKHMCQNHIDDFDWFMRADDDVYVRVEKLKTFLAQIDSNKYIYMGQPGHGVPEVRDRLGLNGHNFCMGGPSVIFNKKALKALCPYIDNCMSEVVSGEEDVEIGRCVSNHLHIECTNAWETLKLFYHSYQEEYTEEKPFLGNLAENVHVEKAITLHHVKLPYIMYKIHRHYMSLLLNASTHSITYLRQQSLSLNKVLPYGKHRDLSVGRVPPDPYKADKIEDVVVWNAFSVESLYSLSYINPSDDITNDFLADLKQIGETAIDTAIDHADSHLSYSHIAGGYYRTDFLRGTDYLLDIYFTSKDASKPDKVKRVHILRPLADLKISNVEEYVKNGKDISIFIVLALNSAVDTASDLEEFMRKYYEQASMQISSGRLQRVKTSLIIASYGGRNKETHDNQDSRSPSVEDVVKWFRVKYPQSNIEAILGQGNNEKNDAVSSVDGYSHNAPQAHTKGASRAIKLWDGSTNGLILLSTLNYSLSRQLFESCMYFSSLKGSRDDSEGVLHDAGTQFYQPIPFSPYSSMPLYGGNNAYNGDSGYWLPKKEVTGENLNLPICGSVNRLVSTGSYMQSNTNHNVIKTLYESIYDYRNLLHRIPDKTIVFRRKR